MCFGPRNLIFSEQLDSTLPQTQPASQKNIHHDLFLTAFVVAVSDFFC